jgi:prepilin-type N-terminal cleavage/methylation domain-containing protein
VRNHSGFTLVELVIATAISAVVLGILTVCFSFTLRLWEVTQHQQQDQTFLMAHLLKMQLSEFDPTPVKFQDNSLHPVFSAQPNMIAFATFHSVKAITQGLPVVVRYRFQPEDRTLFYSELLLNPYDPKAIENFLMNRIPGKNEAQVRAYGVPFQEFLLLYAGGESKQFAESWETSDQFPLEVLIRWRGADSKIYAMMCMVNSPFPVEASNVPAQGSGASSLQ